MPFDPVITEVKIVQEFLAQQLTFEVYTKSKFLKPGEPFSSSPPLTWHRL